MRKTLSIIKKLAVPVLLLALVLYLYSDSYIIKLPDMITSMIDLNNANELENNYYSNTTLGLSFVTPEYDDAEWEIRRYQDSFTARPRSTNKAAKSEFILLKDSDEQLLLLVKAAYMDFKFSINRKEPTKKYAQRKRNDYVRTRASAYRDQYDDMFEVSQPIPIEKNGYIFYKFMAYNILDDEYYTSYMFRHGVFVYTFDFYGWGEKINQELIDGVLETVEFAIPEFKILTID